MVFIMRTIKRFLPLWVGLTAFLIIILLFFILKFAPFGDKSFVVGDANIQYLDFFAFLKNIFAGDAGVGYSLSKVLGGNNVGIVSYYLMSPFNLLLIFFDKVDLHSFFDIAAAIKIGLAAFMMTFYLKVRFAHKLDGDKNKGYFFIGIFGLCYALSQWFITQSNNLMWLDGAYMLQLMMLGIYYVKKKKKCLLLAITVGLAIIFNWYSAGIDCVFSIIWFIFELLNRNIDNRKILDRADVLKSIKKYVIGMGLGVVVSAFIFLPTISAMSASSRGGLEIKAFFNPYFRGNVLSALQGFGLGATSGVDHIALFCGSLVLLSIICIFSTKVFSTKKKILYGALIAVLLLCFYWNPGFIAFCLFKSADSFWCRYAYVIIFALIFLAADFCINGGLRSIKSGKFFKISLLLSSVLLLLNYAGPEYMFNKHIYYTVFFILLIAGVMVIKGYRAKCICLVAVTVSELCFGAIIQMGLFHTDDVKAFREYTQLTEAQIRSIKQKDSGYYRISQTTTRNMQSNNLTANYNESLAYNYWSLSGYSSSPSEAQKVFLDKNGYIVGSVNMNIVDASILGIDSLMGVKYVLSPYPINGLEAADEPSGYDGKKIYQNPFAMPLAFAYVKTGDDFLIEYDGNPFEYQNKLFEKIFGDDIGDLYEQLESSYDVQGNEITYKVKVPDGNYELYANVPREIPVDAEITLNSVNKMAYATWLTPSVLNVPTAAWGEEAIVTIRSDDISVFKNDERQFYAINLDKLKLYSERANSNKPKEMELKDNYAKIVIDGRDGQALFASIPSDDGWTIKVNGKVVEPAIFEEIFYEIPLSEGENVIEMTYSVKHAGIGLLLTIMGIKLIHY